ncbi:hypothetical protein WN943_014037 [Citrus x changshan-huyou]
MENLYLELRFEKDPSNLTSSDLKDDVVSKNQNQTSQECDDELNAHVPVSVNTKTNITKCKLLDYEGSTVVVAEGRWSSSDPKALAHHFSIGPKAMRIWVDVAKEHEKYLWRTTPYMT